MIYEMKKITYASFRKNPPTIINGIITVGANASAAGAFGVAHEIM